jgi:two-component system cell cycle sensor histidine kinase/response regulator CckA
LRRTRWCGECARCSTLRDNESFRSGVAPSFILDLRTLKVIAANSTARERYELHDEAEVDLSGVLALLEPGALIERHDIQFEGRPALELSITNRNALLADAEQRHFANKMEVIARLGGGVAHQFNNLLTAILATTDLASSAPDVSDNLRADLGDIREAAQRAASITRQLLAFSGTQSLSLHKVAVDDLLRELEPLLAHLVPANIRLRLDLSSAATIDTDPVRLEQIVLNLVVNAVDALRNGGVITIGSCNVDGIDATSTHRARTGEFVEIIISDSGMGMNEIAMAQLFEPFASTKWAVGGGMGLGLASAYGTVQQLGGELEVETKADVGTHVRLFLPRAAAAAVATPALPAEAINAAEVVLVVEDEASVRAPMCRMLREHGYHVLEAGNGEHALRVMQEHHAPIHLVITDVMMPEMDGAELVSLLRDWYPSMCVLFISGYSRQFLEARGDSVEGSAFLAKPFSLEAMSRRVRELLDEKWVEAGS